MKPKARKNAGSAPACHSCNQFVDLLNTLPQMAFLLDREGHFTWINESNATETGFSSSELLGRSFIGFIHDQPSAQRALESVQSGNPILHLPVRLLKKDGSIMDLLWSARWQQDSICCSAEVPCIEEGIKTLRGLYEKKLKAHNRRLYDILERIGEGFIAMDESLRVIYWNRQAEVFTGKSREEVLTKNVLECFPGSIATQFQRQCEKAIQTGQPKRYEAFITNDEAWYDISIYPSPNGITAFFRNVTERKNIEEKLELEKKETQKKVTAAVIQAQEKERAQVGQELHDNVNQVLTTVKLYTELCLSGNDNCNELLKRSSHLLQACISEIRALSWQLSAPSLGKIRMIDSIKELVDAITATKRTAINLDTDGIADLEVSDELHMAIYRILQEHLTNILKHADAREVRVFIDRVDDELIMKITDDGKGFDTRNKRSGIGISNMVSRAESLGGRLSLNSAPGLGTVLIATFSLK